MYPYSVVGSTRFVSHTYCTTTVCLFTEGPRYLRLCVCVCVCVCARRSGTPSNKQRLVFWVAMINTILAWQKAGAMIGNFSTVAVVYIESMFREIRPGRQKNPLYRSVPIILGM